jgi:Domain of unknown function (DUF4126)
MDPGAWVTVASSVALAIALAACTGLRAWLPLLLTGSLARAGFLELGPSFRFLSSNRALMILGLATLIEIAADKIPALDHALDAISTVLRPAAGSVVAASVLWPISDPLTALAVGTAVGAPTSLVPHAAKAGLRTASTTFTAGLANPVISLFEDAIAVFMFVASVLIPLAVVLVMVVASIFVLRRLVRRQAVRTA